MNRDGEEVYTVAEGVVLGESGCQSGNGMEHRVVRVSKYTEQLDGDLIILDDHDASFYPGVSCSCNKPFTRVTNK